jgi:hypothetical protein
MRPTLSLDFTEQTVDRRLQFSRPSEAWRFNRHGVLERVPRDTPRIDYDPVAEECRGLLMESESTNLLPASQSGWGRDLHNGVLVNEDTSEVAHLHASSATKKAARTSTGGNEVLWINTGIDVSGYQGQTITGSVYAKASADEPITDLKLKFEYDGGGKKGQNIHFDGSEVWRRAHVTLTIPDGVTSVDFLVETNNGTHNFYLTCPQVEPGHYPTSYIPTDGAPKTRAADTASIDDLGWFDPKKGTIVADFQMTNLESSKHRPRLMQVTGTHNQQYLIQGKGFGNERIEFLNNYDGRYQTRGAMNIGRPLADAPVRYTVGWETGEECFGYVEGDSYSYGAPQSLPGESETGRLRLGGIGPGSIGFYRTWLGELRYYPAYLSERDLRQHSRRPEYAHFDPVVPVTKDMTADAVWDTKGPRYQTLDNRKEVSLRMEVRIQEGDYGVLWEAGGSGRGGSCLVVNNGLLYFHTGSGRSSGSGNDRVEVTAPIAPGDRVIEFSRSSASGKAALYIDGRLVANGQASSLNVISGGDDGAVLTINQAICRNTSGTNADFTGGQEALLDGAYIFLNQLTEDVQ